MSKEMEFVIFCIELYKSEHTMKGKDVYHLFEEYEVLDFLRDHYNALHTQGHRYINSTIEEFLKNRNFVVEKN